MFPGQRSRVGGKRLENVKRLWISGPISAANFPGLNVSICEGLNYTVLMVLFCDGTGRMG